MLSIHCRCVTNIFKISMKKFDPEKNMIDLQGFELRYTESLACSQFLDVPYFIALNNHLTRYICVSACILEFADSNPLSGTFFH